MWKGKYWLRLAGLVMVVALCVRVRSAWPQRRMMLAALVTIGASWIVAVIVSVVPSLQMLVQLQLGRTAALLTLMILPVVAYVVLDHLKQPPRQVWLPLVLIAGGWATAHGRTATVILAVIIGFFAFREIYQLSRKRSRRLFALLWLTAIIAMGIFAGGTVKNNRTKHGFDEGFILRTQSRANRDLQHWARLHTAKDALFMGSLEEVGDFRVFSQRSLYCGHADVLMIAWKPDAAGACDARMEEWKKLGLDREHIADAGIAELNRFCRIKGIDYIFLPGDYQCPDLGKPCYTNRRWAVYDMQP